MAKIVSASLALREVLTSRPVRTARALLLRAADLGARLVGGAAAKDKTAIQKVRGLEDSVTIARDEYGIPGIFAANRHDLAFGMGYACAEDRLFQMELTRRALSGELSAVLGRRPVDASALSKIVAGRTFVDLDWFARAVGFRQAAEASYLIANPASRAWVDAYTAGVNAYVATGRRPLEMLLLDMEPPAWRGADAMLIAKGMAFQLCFSYRFALSRELLKGAVDAERFAALDFHAHPVTVTRDAPPDVRPLLITSELLRAVLGADGLSLGSNAFAVGRSKSADGRVLVGSDPHMPLSAPNVFWEVRLSGGGLDVRGAAVPGFPAIAFGQNAHGAWGATAGWGDDAQLSRENIAALRQQNLLKVREESFVVQGESDPTRMSVFEGPRGPIVSPVLDVLGQTQAGSETGVSLRWTGQDATREVDAALGIMAARNFDEFRDALSNHGGPTLNFVWGDDAGNIGFQYAGRIPQRRGNIDGSAKTVVAGIDLQEGDNSGADWVGMVPFDELPFVVNPPDDVIVSANVRPHGTGYPHMLGKLFQPPYRMVRLRARLQQAGKLRVEDITSIQGDVTSAWALQMRDALLAGLDDVTLALAPRRGQAVVQLARHWDGRAVESSSGAAATYALLDSAIRHVLLDDLGEEVFERVFEMSNTSALVLLRILADDVGPFFAGRDRATVVRDAAAMAEGRLRRKLGDDPNRWSWGALHQVTFKHPFSSIRGLRTISSPGPFPARGDGTTVCMGEYAIGSNFDVRIGPSLRYAMVAGAPADSRGVMTPGQSGDPSSPHYRDQVSLWLGQAARRFTWAEVDFRGARLRLLPA